MEEGKPIRAKAKNKSGASGWKKTERERAGRMAA
jgi:hypothetical protein